MDQARGVVRMTRHRTVQYLPALQLNSLRLKNWGCQHVNWGCQHMNRTKSSEPVQETRQRGLAAVLISRGMARAVLVAVLREEAVRNGAVGQVAVVRMAVESRVLVKIMAARIANLTLAVWMTAAVVAPTLGIKNFSIA